MMSHFIENKSKINIPISLNFSNKPNESEWVMNHISRHSTSYNLPDLQNIFKVMKNDYSQTDCNLLKVLVYGIFTSDLKLFISIIENNLIDWKNFLWLDLTMLDLSVILNRTLLKEILLRVGCPSNINGISKDKLKKHIEFFYFTNNVKQVNGLEIIKSKNKRSDSSLDFIKKITAKETSSVNFLKRIKTFSSLEKRNSIEVH